VLRKTGKQGKTHLTRLHFSIVDREASSWDRQAAEGDLERQGSELCRPASSTFP
jgi:hypothetical protein